MLERLHAVFLLAWGLVRSLALGVFGKKRGLAAFRASYAKDRLLPVPDDARAALFRMGGCIACGLCDVGEGVRRAKSEGTYGGAMDLMLASSRSLPDYDAAARSLAVVDEARLAALEARCPARVPMVAIARFVRAQGAALEAHASEEPFPAGRSSAPR